MLKYKNYAVMKNVQQKEYNEFCKGKVFDAPFSIVKNGLTMRLFAPGKRL